MADSQEKRSPGGGNGRNGRAAYDLNAILDITVAVFNERGYDATSMDHVAARLGTSKSAVYYHASGKEELLRLGLDRALDGLEAVLELTDAQEGRADDRLKFVLREAVFVLIDQLPYVTLLLRVRGNTEVQRTAMNRRREFDRHVSVLIDEARAEGSLRTDIDARTLTRLLFGMINSIVDWYRPEGPLSREQVAEDVIAVAFDGLHASR